MTALYAAHAVGLIRLGFVMLGDRGKAEDVVQDAFLGLYRNWDRLDDPANALTYVRSSVLNGCRTALRTQVRGERRDRAAAALDGRPPFDSTEAAVLLSTDNPSVRVPIQWVINTSPLQALTWIDGDRALAFAAVTTVQTAPSTGNTSGEGTLRSLKVAGPAKGDLLADSTPIWSGHLPWAAPLTSCFNIASWPQQISADGKTLSCGQSNASHIAFVTNSLTAGGKDTIDYQLNAAQGAGIGVLWTSPSGDTLIGVWSNGYSLGQAMPLNFGVISHGTVTPLRFPSSLTSTYDPGQPFPVAF